MARRESHIGWVRQVLYWAKEYAKATHAVQAVYGQATSTAAERDAARNAEAISQQRLVWAADGLLAFDEQERERRNEENRAFFASQASR